MSGGGKTLATARGTDAAQTVWSEGSQPEPNGLTLARHAGQTYKLRPRSSGKLSIGFLTFCAMVLEAAGSEHQAERPRGRFIGDDLVLS